MPRYDIYTRQGYKARKGMFTFNQWVFEHAESGKTAKEIKETFCKRHGLTSEQVKVTRQKG